VVVVVFVTQMRKGPSVLAKVVCLQVLPEGAPSVGVASPGLARLIAAVAVAALAVRNSVGPDVTPGLIVAILLSPVWLPSLSRFRGGRLLAGGLVAALVSGYLLAILGTGHQILTQAQLYSTGLILTLIGGIGVVLWSRTYLSVGAIGVCFGVGLVVNAVLGGATGLAAGNPLKFTWSIPVTVLILSLAALSRNKLLDLVLLAVLCAALTVVDARALFGVCFLALTLVIWQLRPVIATRARSWLRTVTFVGALVVVIYQLSTALVLDGALGTDAQVRSEAQIQASGSLLLGGRPELGATTSLMAHRPMGFGSGVVADAEDIAVAKRGMASLGYDPDNGYVDNFMFGDEVELHSVFGDLWARFGIVGLAVAALIAAQVVRCIAVQISQRAAGGLVVVLGCYTLWNVLFSPIRASVPLLIITIGLLLTVPGVAGGQGAARGTAADAGGTARASSRNNRGTAVAAISGPTP